MTSALVYQSCPKVAPSSNIFQNSHRSHQIFGPLLLKDLSLKYSKIAQSGHTAKESCLTMNLPTEQL